MSRRKKIVSKILENATVRASALRSIDVALDLGNGRTLSTYQDAIKVCNDALDSYNKLLSNVDAAYNVFLESEKKLADASEAMLIGVANKFTKESNEYEMAGGTKKSERKKPVKKKA